MAHTSFLAGEPITAGDLQAVTDEQHRLGATVKATHSYSSDAVTVNVGAAGAGNEWAELEDLGGYGTAGLTATPITIPTGQSGLYAVTIHVLWSLASTGRTFADIKIGGTMVPAGLGTPHRQNAGAGAEDRTSLAVIVPLQAAQTLAIDTFHTKGNSSATTVTVVLSCYKVRF